MPALLTLLVIFDLTSILFLKSPQKSINLNASIVALFYSTDWVVAFNLLPMSYLLHTWSLAIEEQFYLTWPITLFILLRLRLSRTKLLIIVLIFAAISWLWRVVLVEQGATADRVYYMFDTRLDGLLVGCALAIFMASLNSTQWEHLSNGVIGKATRDIGITMFAVLGIVSLVESG